MKKGVAIIVGGVVLVILAGLFWQYQRPERLVTTAVSKLVDAQSQKFAATIELGNAPATQALLGEAGTINLTLNGSYDRPEEKRPSLETTIVVLAKTDSVSMQLEGELRLIEDKAYLFVKTAPQRIPALAQLRGKWVELPRGNASEAPASELSGPLFANVKRAGRETINKQSTSKLTGEATSTAIVRFLEGVAEIVGTSLTNEQLASLQSSLTSKETVPVTLWVAPWSRQLRQVSLALQGPNNQRTSYTIQFSDPNQKTTITVPEGAQTLNAALQLPSGTPAP